MTPVYSRAESERHQNKDNGDKDRRKFFNRPSSKTN